MTPGDGERSPTSPEATTALEKGRRAASKGWVRGKRTWRQISGEDSRAQQRRIRELEDRVAHLETALSEARPAGTEPFVDLFAPGHYYSPVPSLTDIGADEARLWPATPEAPLGLAFDGKEILHTFETVAAAAREVVLPATPTPDRRYHSRNDYYGPGDALTLAGMMLTLSPKRYVEIGSGWSTALALDIDAQYLDHRVEFTCIEPNPDRLRRLVRDTDRVDIIEEPVQQLPLDWVETLQPNDILFIDCSHVLKIGSDVHHIVSQVLPRVPVGVRVHIHDIFWPFEYLRDWVHEGRAWNECYVIHAFLMYNHTYRVVLFNDWLRATHPEVIQASWPAVAANPGVALWLERIAERRPGDR